ncbi:hypothetical protein [Sulfurimonas microaerophilic]|uniref:hypothetical protein n=1 Tax=Sulfurimonas microaerophilic TaxID=3058392 RepID=UPI002714F2A6|nr:hypothetical protein [Sulfurimonas sp. hsl 1-7]
MSQIPIQVIRLGVVGAVVGGVIAFKTIAANAAEEKIDKAISNLGIPKEKISYDVSVDLIGLSTRIEDIEMKISDKESFKIDEIVINDIDTKHEVPEYLDVEINGMHNDAKALKMVDRSLYRALDSLKKDEFITNFALNYNFDKEAKVLSLENLSFDIEDMGALSLTTQFHNVNSVTNAAMGFNYAKLGKSSVTYKDDSLVNTLVSYNAKKSGKDIEQFKEKILKNLDRDIQRAEKREQELEVKMLTAIAEFVKDPQSIEFSMEPEQPISLNKLTKRFTKENTLKTLNFDIKVN